MGEGKELVLNVTADGVPTPMLTWQRDGVALTDDQGCHISTNGGQSQLRIDVATGNASGWYQCTAINVGGTAATRGKVIVEAKPGQAAPKDSLPQRRQAERYEEMEDRSERLGAIDALEAKRRKIEADQTRQREFDDSYESERLNAIQLLELRREQANRPKE